MRVCPSNKSHLMSVIINLSFALLSLLLDPIIITDLYFLENYASKNTIQEIQKSSILVCHTKLMEVFAF